MASDLVPDNRPRLSGGPRTLALQIAAEARAEWGYVSDIIARTFRAHRELGSPGRRKIAETVYGLIRFDRRLDAIVDELLEPVPRGDAPSRVARDELKLIVLELREGLPPDAVKGDLRRLVRAELDPEVAIAPDAGLGRLHGLDREAVRLSVPNWLLACLCEQRGQPAAEVLLEGDEPTCALAVRVNTALTTREKLIAELAEEGVTARPGRWTPTALVLTTRVNAFGLSAFRRGLFEVMDEGSQLVAELVAPPPGGRVWTRARARVARRWRWPRRCRAKGACWRSTSMERNWRSCAAARGAPA